MYISILSLLKQPRSSAKDPISISGAKSTLPEVMNHFIKLGLVTFMCFALCLLTVDFIDY